METVRGPVDDKTAGIVSFGEHLLFHKPGWRQAYDSEYDRPSAFERSLESLRRFRAGGGGTVVDIGGMLLGRDIEYLRSLSRASGVNIIATTGLPSTDLAIGYFDTGVSSAYIDRGSAKGWLREVPGSFYPGDGGRPEHLGRMIANEIQLGMACPGMYRAGSVAGAIIFGCDLATGSAHEHHLLLATVAAARYSGAPVVLTGRRSDAVASAFLDLGVLPNAIVATGGDVAGNVDVDRDSALAATGSYILYDHVGWGADGEGPTDSERVELVGEMIQRGHGDRLLLGTGSRLGSVGWPQTDHGPDALIGTFLADMLERYGAEACDRILRVNPLRVLATPIVFGSTTA